MNAEIQVKSEIENTAATLTNIPIPATASSADECAAAAEVYDCGQKKAPALTNAIQNNLQAKAAAVSVGVRKIEYIA
jgi:S-adenosylmethionine/arginine decarboxylase-like enzyme